MPLENAKVSQRTFQKLGTLPGATSGAKAPARRLRRTSCVTQDPSLPLSGSVSSSCNEPGGGQISMTRGLGSLWGEAGGELLQRVVTHKLLCPQQPQVLVKQGGPLPQPGPEPITEKAQLGTPFPPDRCPHPVPQPASALGRCPLCCSVPIWHLSLLQRASNTPAPSGGDVVPREQIKMQSPGLIN